MPAYQATTTIVCSPIYSFGGVDVRESICVGFFCSPSNGVAGITKFDGVDCWGVLADINPKGGEQRSLKLGAQVDRCLAFQFAQSLSTDPAVFL